MWLPLLYFTVNTRKHLKKGYFLKSNHQTKCNGTVVISLSQICVHMILILLVQVERRDDFYGKLVTCIKIYYQVQLHMYIYL